MIMNTGLSAFWVWNREGDM